MKRTVTVLDSKLLRTLSLAWEAQFPRVERDQMHKELKSALASYARQCKTAKQRQHAQLVNCAQWELEMYNREQEGRHEAALGGRSM